MANISIAFVDDHPTFLEGLAAIFAGIDGYNVLAKGRCAADAIDISTTKSPDIIVIDLNMPGNAFEAIAHIRKCCPDVKLLTFTASVHIDHAVSALEAGSSGYILKGSTVDELIDAIRSIMLGETYITPSFASKVITGMRNAAALRSTRDVLSVRETQIVDLLLSGRTNKEIANSLNIGEKTVKYYMTLLMQKMHVRNRVEVVIAAQREFSANIQSGGGRSQFSV